MASSLWPFRAKPVLDPEVAEAVARWRALPERDGTRPASAGRWVVVDVETSGLDAGRDALIAIGALAVTDGEIVLGDSFEVVLRQACPSSVENIEVHGIGGTEQSEGMAPAEALAAFLAFAGKDPLVAFHAPFDAIMLKRHLDQHLGVAFRRHWLDLADVAPLAWPRLAGRLSGLDDWLEAFAIPMQFRHRAIADCLATAQLLLMVQREAQAIGAPTTGRLLSLTGVSRWLS